MRLGLRPHGVAGARASASARGDSAFRQQFEPQRACYWCCFYQTNVDDVPQPVHGTAACADQRVARLVIIEVFGAERADRDQAVGAGIARV